MYCFSRIHSFSIFVVLVLSVLNLSTVQAQQFLNLDFEKSSAEGLARPWGWNILAFSPNVSCQADTTVVKSGYRSLRIESSEPADDYTFEYTFAVEPSQLLARSVDIAGWLKTSDFSGEIGLKLQAIGRRGDDFDILREVVIDFPSFSDWQMFVHTGFDLGTELHTLRLTIFYQGTGTVWFDGLRLILDGKELQNVPVAPPFDEAQLAWLQERVQVFTTPYPAVTPNLKLADFSDLQPFGEVVKNARIIALGEATHGTGEFFKLKHRLLQYGIKELGVRTFILEDNQLPVERINRYVLWGEGSARSSIRGLFAVWNTQEMLEMIEWIRAYNKDHPDDPVAFMGMDVQNPQPALEQLQQALLERDVELAHLTDSLLADFTENWRTSFFKSDEELQTWINQAELAFQNVSSATSRWMEDASATADSTAILWIEQHARLIWQCTRSMATGAFEGRDQAMAENVNWIIEYFSNGSPVVVWAHDTHVSRGEATRPEDNYFLGASMGSHLARQYGDAYRAFGLSTYQGTCRGTISYSDFTQIAFPLYTSPIGSLDEGLHQINESLAQPNLFLPLRSTTTNPLPRWLGEPRPVRYVGYVAEDFGFGGRHILPQQFDGVFFVDHTTASTKIE